MFDDFDDWKLLKISQTGNGPVHLNQGGATS